MSSPEPATRTINVLPISTPASSTSAWPSSQAISRHGTTQAFPPMTTHWTKPQSCTWTYVVDNRSQLASPGAVAWLDLEPVSGASTLSCYPDGMFLNGRTGIFSPATCPSGWTTASLRVRTNEDCVLATTTAVCCSSYFTLDGSHCKRSVPTVLAVPISYNRTAGTYHVMSNSTTTLYSATLAVNTILALFMEQDKHILGLTDDEAISHHGIYSSSLSLAARIGIVIAVAVFAVLSAGALAFCIMRWRRSRRKQTKGDRSHELGFMQSGQPQAPERHAPDGSRFGANNRPVAEPPPAYQASTEMSSSAAEPGAGCAQHTREEEIRALIAQKAAIQQRIEELESFDDAEGRSNSRT